MDIHESLKHIVVNARKNFLEHFTDTIRPDRIKDKHWSIYINVVKEGVFPGDLAIVLNHSVNFIYAVVEDIDDILMKRLNSDVPLEDEDDETEEEKSVKDLLRRVLTFLERLNVTFEALSDLEDRGILLINREGLGTSESFEALLAELGVSTLSVDLRSLVEELEEVEL